MEDSFFNFSPVDKVPTGSYKKKEAKHWDWMDFFYYFEDQYTKKIGGNRWVTIKQRNSKKKIIEQSYEFWGKDVFKAMIDWLFENYKDYPQWNEVSLGLVCGSHYWAKMIAENAKKQMELDKRWERQ